MEGGSPGTAAPGGPGHRAVDSTDVLGRRIAAGLIDVAILAVLFAVLSSFLGESTSSGASFEFRLEGAAFVLYLVLVLLYYFGLEAATARTPGKLALGLRVATVDGRRPDAKAIALRTVLRLVDGLPFLYLVGFVAMLATGSRRQRVGDLAADTLVTRS